MKLTKPKLMKYSKPKLKSLIKEKMESQNLSFNKNAPLSEIAALFFAQYVPPDESDREVFWHIFTALEGKSPP